MSEAKQSLKDLAEQAVKMPWEDRAPYECRRNFKDAIEPELFLEMLAALEKVWSEGVIPDCDAIAKGYRGALMTSSAMKERERAELLALALKCGAFQNDGGHGIPDGTLITFEPDELAEFAAALPQSKGEGWMPIETAPSDVVVLLFTPELHYTNPQRIEARVYHDTSAGSRHAWATHWMPLPAAPSEQGDQQ
jgi:hypothetical protein